jgi:YfiH family protein
VPKLVTLSKVTRGPLRVYPIDVVAPLGVDAFVTDRLGGISAAPYDELNLALHVGDDVEHVVENLRRVGAAIGVSDDELVTARQVHGNKIVEVSPYRPKGDADGLVSSSRSLALAILVADCVPILLVDEASERFAVVHAGWRGLANGVLANAVSCFDAPRAVHAFIGPSISVECYQVGPDVAVRFEGIPGALVPDGGDRSFLDLRAVSSHQLLALGLQGANVSASTQVTDGGEQFYSDRATRPCGRFALVAKRAS